MNILVKLDRYGRITIPAFQVERKGDCLTLRPVHGRHRHEKTQPQPED